MSLIQSARLNGHEPFAYLKDVSSPACRRSRRVGSVSCCRIGGGPIQPETGQEGIAGCLRINANQLCRWMRERASSRPSCPVCRYVAASEPLGSFVPVLSPR